METGGNAGRTPLLLLRVCAFLSTLSLCGCYDKWPQTEWLTTTHKKEFSPSPEGRKSKIRVSQGRVRPQVSGEGPACLSQLPVAPWPLHPNLGPLLMADLPSSLSGHCDGSLTQDDLLTEGPFSPSAKTLSPWEVTVQVPGALLSPRRKWRPVGWGRYRGTELGSGRACSLGVGPGPLQPGRSLLTGQRPVSLAAGSSVACV